MGNSRVQSSTVHCRCAPHGRAVAIAVDVVVVAQGHANRCYCDSNDAEVAMAIAAHHPIHRHTLLHLQLTESVKRPTETPRKRKCILNEAKRCDDAH